MSVEKYMGSSVDELAQAIKQGQIVIDPVAIARSERQLTTFRDRFGPGVLAGLSGEQLLRTMHGREDGEARCLAYWLEFKNDDEFSGHGFGGIGGGSALKFGVFQRKADGMWISGNPQNLMVRTLAEAIGIAERQRDELVAGSRILDAMTGDDTSDARYERLQSELAAVAPDLADDGWAHKYWFLCHPNRLDSFHSPRYQRFYLYKMLQMPPDGLGIRDPTAARFSCAGRFISAARQLSLPIATLASLIGSRSGAFHRYWKVGTTEGDTGPSRWADMRGGGFVSIGWPDHVSDLSPLLADSFAETKKKVATMLTGLYKTANVTTRKAGEIVNFSHEIAENDIVLACEGRRVLGVGRVSGSYRHDASLRFPHLRPVDWLSLEQWELPAVEGPQTSVFELGQSGANLLAIEQHLSVSAHANQPSAPVVTEEEPIVSALDHFTSRVDALLRRKGQLIFYGPPGTGKTYRAIQVAEELAARQAFRRSASELSDAQRQEISGPGGLVRTCTFHPGWGYEDFVQGLRPTAINGQMHFEPRDGIFKQLCTDAAARPERHFFLVVDEINRTDLPRTFGELMTIIEVDKRGRKVTLPLTGEPFSIPKNVYLIGTMNTADRSISLLDTALRRRFGFIELMPDSRALVDVQVGGLRLGAWLDALNMRIRGTLKRDARNLQIGHAYLMPSPPIKSVAEFSRVLRDDIIPLLEEYCYEDPEALHQILGPSLVDLDAGRIRDSLFAPQQEEVLIQAMQFHEMESLTVDQPITDSPLAKESETLADEDGLDHAPE